eukprot:12317915-Ditylum_brightwellii.AAC.1
MARNSKKVQWCNTIQNHQNGQPLLVLDPKVAGHEAVELYQWEMCIHFHLCGASTKIPMVDVGDKSKIASSNYMKCMAKTSSQYSQRSAKQSS